VSLGYDHDPSVDMSGYIFLVRCLSVLSIFDVFWDVL
jgi:hypothetical protein